MDYSFIFDKLVWPGVVLILGLIALFRFNAPLIRLIDRIKKIGPTELATEQGIQETAKNLRPTPSDEALKVFDNRLLLAREDTVRKELEARGISTPSEKERVLLRHFSGLLLGYQFEKLYNHIWGSQLAALQFLNTRGDQGCQQSDLFVFYTGGKNAFPQFFGEYPFDRWCRFLESSSVIRVADDKISITLEGREFLKYLLDQTYSFHKPG